MPKVEELIEALQQYKDVQSQLDQAQSALVDAQKQLNDTVAASDRRAKEILDAATQAARSKGLEVDAREKAVAQKESDVASREQAVKGFPAQQAALDAQSQQLDAALKDAETEKANALATQQSWQLRAKELDDKAAVLEQRLAKLTEWENRLRQNLPVADIIG